MQEEVNQKTVALSIRAAKLSGKVLASAFQKVLGDVKKHHQKALTPQGRQSVKKLMNHYLSLIHIYFRFIIMLLLLVGFSKSNLLAANLVAAFVNNCGSVGNL